MIDVIKVNDYMSFLSGKFFCRNVSAIQFIGNLHFYRKFLIGRSLIVDIVSPRIPGNGSVGVFRKGFIACNIFNVVQKGFVLQGHRTVRVLQPVTDNDLLSGSRRIGNDIYRLIFAALICVSAVILFPFCVYIRKAKG